jgi:hypothetical protein
MHRRPLNVPAIIERKVTVFKFQVETEPLSEKSTEEFEINTCDWHNSLEYGAPVSLNTAPNHLQKERNG